MSRRLSAPQPHQASGDIAFRDASDSKGPSRISVPAQAKVHASKIARDNLLARRIEFHDSRHRSLERHSSLLKPSGAKICSS
jgi:hypothetical protein